MHRDHFRLVQRERGFNMLNQGFHPLRRDRAAIRELNRARSKGLGNCERSPICGGRVEGGSSGGRAPRWKAVVVEHACFSFSSSTHIVLCLERAPSVQKYLFLLLDAGACHAAQLSTTATINNDKERP